MEVNYPFDNLKVTLLGGQAFNWDLINDSYYGFFTNGVVKLSTKGSKLKVDFFPQDFEFDIATYLDLDRDYFAIQTRISKDEHIIKAINYVKQVGILKQDFEQTLLSFILSSHNSIASVRKLVRSLAYYFGNKIIVDGLDFYTFPKSIDIANSSEKKLRDLKLGFRSRYLLESSLKLSTNSVNFQDISEEEDLRSYLKSFSGVGDKIADCVMAFSLNQTSVTPLDVWAKRVLVDLYGVNEKTSYENMRKWYKNYFGNDAVFAGQYLFEYYRRYYRK